MSAAGRTTRVDVAVVGAGLAGCLLAESLRSRRPARSVMLIDDDHAHAGWKNPAALCHPVPGASLRPAPHQADAFALAAARWRSEPAARQVTLHRALPPGPRSARMLKTLPEAQAAFARAGVRLEHRDDAVVIHPAFVVRLHDFITERRRTLAGEGVMRLAHRAHVLSDDNDGVYLRAGETEVHARVVVFAGGAGFIAPTNAPCPEDDWARPLETEGGETVQMDGGAPDAWVDARTARTARGAFVVAHGAPGLHAVPTLRLGATHVPTDAAERSAHVIGSELADRLGQDVEAASFSAVYRGARAFYRRDRLPLAGAVGARGRRFVLTGLGGTGLLWAPYLAQRLAAAIDGEDDVPEAFAPRRAALGA